MVGAQTHVCMCTCELRDPCLSLIELLFHSRHIFESIGYFHLPLVELSSSLFAGLLM